MVGCTYCCNEFLESWHRVRLTISEKKKKTKSNFYRNKKITSRKIVLFTTFSTPVNPDSVEEAIAGLKQFNIELTVMFVFNFDMFIIIKI